MAKKKLHAQYEVIGNSRCVHDFEIGDKVTLVYDDGTPAPEFRRDSDGYTQYVHMEEVKRIKKPKKPKKAKTEKAEVKFELGDVVEIISTKGGTCNSVGDIGVITEMGGSDCRVQVPGKKSLGNWSHFSTLKHTGLKGSLKGGN